MVINTPDAPATKKQLWLLHILTKEDTREWKLTMQEASDKIQQLKNKRPLVNPHTSAIKRDKQLLKQQRYDKMLVHPGEYFYTSWGYDQTNIDYIVVVGVSSSGKTAQCRMVSPIHVGESGTSDVLTPGTAYGDVFNMKIKTKDNISGDDVVLRGSYPFCQGSKRLDTFWKTEIGETKHQTMSQFGH